MLRADPNNPTPDGHDGPLCPSLIDLAAFAENRLGEDEADRIIAHAAGCAACLSALENLLSEVAAINEDSCLLLVPASVLESAMSLRAADTTEVPIHVPMRATPSWMIFMRRGAALAACAAIAGAGYRIGDSFTAPASSDGNVVASADGFDFGLLDSETDSDGLFAIALAEGAIAKEATP